MNTVFVGGSRHLSSLPLPIKERLNNIVSSGHKVIVGDANGADKAVQKFLLDAAYEKVIVFCSGAKYRNNLGRWPARPIETPKNAKGFQFYAIKDRQMAQEADFGLMIWDGESPGTVLNVLRLIRAGKIAVMFEAPKSRFITFKTASDWNRFVVELPVALVADLKARATPEEWIPEFQDPPARSQEEWVGDINAALAKGDTAAALAGLGEMAKLRGMSQIARETGLAREGLYRSLKGDGNPEFATVMKVMQALGLRLRVDGIENIRASAAGL
jgi:probable addiction module antidote protein